MRTSAFGFGADFNEQLLTTLADRGGGNFRFIARPEDAGNAFREEFGEVTALIGQGLELRLTPAPQVTIVEELAPVQPTHDGRARVYRFGDVVDGAVHRVILRLQIEAGAAHDQTVPLTGTAAWLDVDTLETRELATDWRPRFAATPDSGPVDHEVLDEVILAKCAEVKVRAADAASNGRPDEARRLIDGRLEVIDERLRSGGEFANTGLLQAERRQLALIRDAIDQQDANLGKHVAQQQADLRAMRGAHLAGRERKHAVQVSLAAGDRAGQQEAIDEIGQRLIDLGAPTDLQRRGALCVKELVANAVDHGCQGKPEAVFKVQAVLRRVGATITVADSGPGFDADAALERARRAAVDGSATASSSPLDVQVAYDDITTDFDPCQMVGACASPGRTAPHSDQARRPRPGPAVAARGRGIRLVLANSSDLSYSHGGRVATVRLAALPTPGVLTLDNATAAGPAAQAITAELRIHPATAGGAPIAELRLAGDLDSWTVDRARQALREVIERGATDIVLDCANVGVTDSAGLGFFVRSHREVTDVGGRLVLVSLPGTLQQTVTQVQLHHTLPILPDLPAAVAWFASRG